MSQEPRSAMLKLNRSVNFTPGPIGEACCVPWQIQSPTNHFSTDSCSGSFCASATLAGLSWAKADRARSAKARMSIFFILWIPQRDGPSASVMIGLSYPHIIIDFWTRQDDAIDACGRVRSKPETDSVVGPRVRVSLVGLDRLLAA